jgi:trehalose synthase
MAALQEVPVASLSPERFESLLGQGWKQVDEAIDEARRLLKGRVVWNVNSTARGGGVAEPRLLPGDEADPQSSP